MARPEKRKSVQKPNKMILGRTLFLAIVCGIVAFAVLGVKLYQVMIVQHDFYEQKAVEQQTRTTTVAADRGTIYDANGNVLAMSATAYTVFISPYEIKKYDEDVNLIAENLAKILDVDASKIIEQSLDTESWYKTVAKKIDVDLADEVRAFKDEYDLMGVHLEEDSKRYYPYSNLASHVIGFVGAENYGLEGIEAVYDEYLSGTDGSVVRLADGEGSEMASANYEYYYDAVDGSDVTLTIDVNAQAIAEKYLEQAIEDYGVKYGGCAIVMNVNTGEILAMANKDDYDPNNYLQVSEKVQEELDKIENEDEYNDALGQARLEQWRNMAIQDTYEPGSVFKIITMSMALEEGSVGTDSSFYCDGSTTVIGRKEPIKCWKTTGHGSQNLKEAAMHSCNVAFVNIGLSVGAESFYDYIEAFGLFDKTGIDLLSEGSSIWWDEDVFYDSQNLSQLAAASFGQTFNITPIQMITAVSAVANGGYLVEPHLVSKIVDNNGNIEYSKGTTVVNQVISTETSSTVCEILEAVVGEKGGTGSNAYVPGYRIAGKTGTSEKVADQVAAGEGTEKEYMVSFCGFAPADDPQVAVLVILDTPSSDCGVYISGGNMAAPVVGSIFSELLPYMGVDPVYNEGEQSNIDVTVPKLTGKTVDEVGDLLDNYGLTFRVEGEGDTVVSQLPRAQSEIAAGSEIIVYTDDSESADRTVPVPNIAGLSVSQAKSVLAEYGLYLHTTGASVTNESAVVSKQSVEYGTEVKYGSVIEATLVDMSQEGRY